MSRAFKNPVNGHVETTGSLGPIAVLLLGPIYLLFRGLWAHAMVWLVIAIGLGVATGPGALLAVIILSIIYAFAINGILANNYLRNGWLEVKAPFNGSAAETVSVAPTPAENDPSEIAWTIAMDEYESGKKSTGLWAKCFARAEGDEQKAKAAYLEARARELSAGSTPL